MAKEYFYRGVTSSAKSDPSDLVTEADVAISNFFVKKIGEQFPSHHIHTEEMDHDINAGAEYEWVIDPLDGTRNFARGIPMWCIAAALLRHGETVMAGVYHPIAEQFFFAEGGKGVWLNDERLTMKADAPADLAYSSGHMVVVHDRPYYAEYKKAMNKFLDANGRFFNFHTLLGACYVATGAMHFFADDAGLDHDYLPSALICSEAGMVVSDVEGKPWKRGRQDIVIANPKLHPKVLELFL